MRGRINHAVRSHKERAVHCAFVDLLWYHSPQSGPDYILAKMERAENWPRRSAVVVVAKMRAGCSTTKNVEAPAWGICADLTRDS